MVVHHVRKPTNIIFMFFKEGAAVNTRQDLALLRRLEISLIDSVVESVLTQRIYCVAQSVITVPVSLQECKRGDKCDYCSHNILFRVELKNMNMFQDHEVCQSSVIILLLARVYFQILQFYHTAYSNYKCRPQYY
jgi:DNA-directed RNA polymerase subunit RPC12/RpoP